MTEHILSSIGKKMRTAYLAGKATDDEVIRCYNRNKKEADAFNPFGLTVFDLISIKEKTHNTILRRKLEDLIEQHKQKSRCSIDQNKLNLQKLDFYTDTALGMGLRPVMKQLRSIVRTSGNEEAEILLMLMQIEFANLVAKKRHDKKKRCYERKDFLLMDISYLLEDNGWKHGISYTTGKNASCLVYVYLPDGTQLSWHSNSWQMTYYYDEASFTWDGQACSSLEKLLTYAHDKFGIGKELTKFPLAA